MARTPEGRVKKAIRQWLQERDIYYCMPQGTGYGQNGVPDFICCWDGQFLAIEAKAKGKRSTTTKLQDLHLELIAQAGGWSIVVDDVTQLDELEARYDARGDLSGPDLRS